MSEIEAPMENADNPAHQTDGSAGGADDQGAALYQSVIPIDRRVKRILLHWVGLFRTYRDAAASIDVDRSTVAVYLEGAQNISQEVLEKIIGGLRANVDEASLIRRHGKDWEKEVWSNVKARNFRQTDDEAYQLTDGLHRFLDFYTRLFPNRVRAARSLDVNPRTYKAYVKHTVRTFPASRFDVALEQLEKRGVSQAQAMRQLGISSWDEILERVKRPRILELDDRQILERLLNFQRRGGTSLSRQDTPLYNLVVRRFGGPREAIEKLSGDFFDQAEDRMNSLLRRGQADRAAELLTEFEEVVRLLSRATRSGRRGRGQHKPEFVERMKALAERQLELREALYRDAPLSHRYLAKDDFSRFRFRFRHLHNVVPYSPLRSYRDGQLIHHTDFGVGRVLRHAARGRIEVLFRGPLAPEEAVVLSARS